MAPAQGGHAQIEKCQQMFNRPEIIIIIIINLIIIIVIITITIIGITIISTMIYAISIIIIIISSSSSVYITIILHNPVQKDKSACKVLWIYISARNYKTHTSLQALSLSVSTLQYTDAHYVASSPLFCLFKRSPLRATE